MPTTSSTDFESDAILLGWVPVGVWNVKGRLRLRGGRFTFHPFLASDSSHAVDVGVLELHSPARSELGLQLWHGGKRLRFSFVGGGPANAELVQDWVQHLSTIVGPPPADVRVRPPWPRWAWLTITIGGYTALTLLVVLLLQLVR